MILSIKKTVFFCRTRINKNFYKILEIEPITIKNEDYEKSSLIPSFRVAEEKAVKTIQKHSMRINGIQRNSQIAKAYLLLGKARYYDRRFFPAMEAFNFLLEQYSNEEIFVEAKIWREKTNLRLSNNNLALKNLLSLSKDLKSGSKFNSLLNSSISQGFLNLKNIDSAIVYLNKAIKSERNLKVNSRLTFIQAQLYENLGMKDSIKDVLADLIDKKRYWKRLLI
jgi:tetratricopeptide (TPR) repeat protein